MPRWLAELTAQAAEFQGLRLNWLFERPRFTPEPPTEWLFVEALCFLGASFEVNLPPPDDARIPNLKRLNIKVSVGPYRRGWINIATPASKEAGEVFQTFDCPVGDWSHRQNIWKPFLEHARLFIATGPWVLFGKRAKIIRQGVRPFWPFNPRGPIKNDLLFLGKLRHDRRELSRLQFLTTVSNAYGKERRNVIASSRFCITEPPIREPEPVEDYWSNRIYILAQESAAIIAFDRPSLRKEFEDTIAYIKTVDDVYSILHSFDDGILRRRVWEHSSTNLTYCHRAVSLLEVIWAEFGR